VRTTLCDFARTFQDGGCFAWMCSVMLEPPRLDGLSIQALAILLGGRSMDGLTWTVFALAAFAGCFVSGFSGFAMGLVVSGA
jgi:hypothetical protein